MSTNQHSPLPSCARVPGSDQESPRITAVSPSASLKAFPRFSRPSPFSLLPSPFSLSAHLEFFLRLPLSRSSLVSLSSAVFLLSAISSAFAQPVISSPPAAQLVPASMREITGSAPTSSTSAPTVVRSGRSSQDTPFYWGPLSVRPHFSDRFIYSDGLQAAAGRPLNSYVNTFSPGVQVDLGTNWTADYTATWTAYTNKAFKESLDHAVRVAGRLAIKNWAGQFEQGYSTSNSPLIETARQTAQENVSTHFGISKAFDRHLSVQSGISQNLSFIAAAPDNYAWSTDNWVLYRLNSKLEGSAGFAAGYVDMVPGANMAYVTPMGRVSWKPSSKLSFSAQGGEEIRQIYSRGVSALYTPVFEVSADYGPFDNTRFTLSAGRTVSPSVLRNQVSDGTHWTVGFSQRLLGHFNLSGSYGEQENGYVATNSRVTGGRKDMTYNYSLRIGTTFLRRGTVNLLFQKTDNSSNSVGYGFNSRQTGVEVGYRY